MSNFLLGLKYIWEDFIESNSKKIAQIDII